MSISRLHAWNERLLRSLVENKERSGRCQKVYTDAEERTMESEIKQLIGNVSKIVERCCWENVTGRTGWITG